MTILASIWPFIVAALGVVWGIFSHLQKKTAQAETETAKNMAVNARADANVAQAAITQVQTAQTVRAAVDADVAKTTGASLDKALKDEGFVE